MQNAQRKVDRDRVKAGPGEMWKPIVRVMRVEPFESVWHKHRVLAQLGVYDDPYAAKRYLAAFGTLINAGAIIRLPGSAKSGVGEQLILAKHMFDESVLLRSKIPEPPAPIVDETPKDPVAAQNAKIAALENQVRALEASGAGMASRVLKLEAIVIRLQGGQPTIVPAPVQAPVPAPAPGLWVPPAPEPEIEEVVDPNYVPTHFPNFGQQRGKPIRDAAIVDLQWYMVTAEESLNDPTRKKYRAKNIANIKAYKAEIERQQNLARKK